MKLISIWTMAIIFYQTFICIIISWLTLDCKLAPNTSELHEVTLMKLLYLYDPTSCGRVFFYNHTKFYTNTVSTSTIVWPVRNNVALNFRRKIRLWLSLHVLWAIFAIANLTQNQRPCGFYAALLPFTAIGTAILIMDLVFVSLFLMDTSGTATEAKILEFISNKQYFYSINKKNHTQISKYLEPLTEVDTSWISLFFAFVSCRGIVQWIINFWLVKDNYFEGLALYRKLQLEKPKQRLQKKNSVFV